MKTINHKEFDLLQNEYIINQGQVKNYIACYIRQRNIAYIFAVIVLLISFAVTIMAITITRETKKIDKLVFKEDGSGGLTYMGQVSTKLKIDEVQLIRAQMAEYITALYSIPSDDNQRQYNAFKVQYMTATNYYPVYPQLTLRDEYSKHGNELTTIHISTIGEIMKGVWEIDWSKKVNNQPAGNFNSKITFTQIETSGSTEIALYNALGIAVTNITTQERI